MQITLYEQIYQPEVLFDNLKNMFYVHKPNLVEKFFFFVSGAIISTPFPALANSLLGYLLVFNFPRFNASLISIVLLGPLLEEFAKAYPLFYRHGETRHSIFTLGFLTGLGFGVAEFFLYVYIYQASFLIRLPLILFHATNTAVTSFGIGKKKALPFYLLAFALHMIYNLSLIMPGVLSYSGLIIILLSYILALFFYLKIRKPKQNMEAVGF